MEKRKGVTNTQFLCTYKHVKEPNAPDWAAGLSMVIGVACLTGSWALLGICITYSVSFAWAITLLILSFPSSHTNGLRRGDNCFLRLGVWQKAIAVALRFREPVPEESAASGAICRPSQAVS